MFQIRSRIFPYKNYLKTGRLYFFVYAYDEYGKRNILYQIWFLYTIVVRDINHYCILVFILRFRFTRVMNTENTVYCQIGFLYTIVILDINCVCILVFILRFPVFLCIRRYIFSNSVIISRIHVYPME